MPPRGPPSAKEIETIARRTINIIKDHITSEVCVFGNAAAYLWADIGRLLYVPARHLHCQTRWTSERVHAASTRKSLNWGS